jgi:sortase A
MRRDTRPLALAIVIVAMLLANATVYVARAMAPAEARAVDSPLLHAVSAPATTAPPTTAAGLAPTRKLVPVPPPANGYAAEKIVRIGTIEIPKIGLVHPIYEGITLNSIDLGPSHWPGTAFPGEVGNAVFAGHRVTHTHPFLRINELVPGDVVIFTVGGLRSVYRMTGSRVVRPSETWIANQTATPTATLFGCHPPHSATYRYVVSLALESVQPV